MKKKEVVKIFDFRWFIVLLVIALFFYAVWFLFFSYETCDSWSCFNNNLGKCDKTKFIGGSEMIFEYIIKGSSGDECIVEVELLQGELGNQDFEKLAGDKMECSLPLGVVMLPESNLNACTGKLKEDLQGLVIKKLYTYIVQNLGQLNLEVADLPKGVGGY